ncbi:matrixin family metalloprotease [Chitinophaga sp. sic0106]|uniref:matrixin family metalloprotease n=1 Tax=Chitinophaga sp. sic0106 TaxID=2854785 RepID=UPI001C45F885|nr:matrixin family metalloprotease [Chitinophaga sp. sic0106]MBV7530639.1 matrixin family metalloprotease [Chitinophaga sp. sic0106]
MKKVVAFTVAAASILLFSTCISRKSLDANYVGENYYAIQAYDGFSDMSIGDTVMNDPGPLSYIDGKDTLIYQHRRIEIDGEPFYLVEGDILMTPDQYDRFRNKTPLFKKPKYAKRQLKQRELWGMKDEFGKLLQWPKETVLTFAIIERSFSTKQQYETVRKNMLQAVDEWQKICDIKFEYIAAKDKQYEKRPTEGLQFVVIGVESYNKFIACAFPPKTATPERRLRIDSSYFHTDYDKVGLLRHEIGHVLGFIHEQIRVGAPPVCREDVISGDFTEITDYDDRSVMHYYCGGKGTLSLAFTDQDKKGAVEAFGPPKK